MCVDGNLEACMQQGVATSPMAIEAPCNIDLHTVERCATTSLIDQKFFTQRRELRPHKGQREYRVNSLSTLHVIHMTINTSFCHPHVKIM